MLGVYSQTIFTRRVTLSSPSPFIRAMHPKSAIRPQPEAIQRILAKGWVGQLKIHGHRAQIHIPAEENKPLIAYTRQGRRHKLALAPKIASELRRVFGPDKGWNVLDTEWLKPAEKIFVFDILKKDGEILRRLSFPDRYALLRRDYLSPHLVTLPLISDFAGCQKALAKTEDYVEGLVFRSTTRPGFADTSIIRCRK